MVNLKHFFNLLATGEFSNTSVNSGGIGELKEQNYPQVVNDINLGIIEIYKRFSFLENDIFLHIDPTVEMYYLREERLADLNNINTKTYLEHPDSSEGCLHFIEIKEIYDADGNPLVLNNRFKTPAIVQKSHDTLKITGHTAAERYMIVYQAYPDKVVIEDDADWDPAEVFMNIPATIVETLLNFVAMRYFKPTGANTSDANADKSGSYQAQYELSCQKLDLYGLDIQNLDEENKFEDEGWA